MPIIQLVDITPLVAVILSIAVAWSLVWKGIALWIAAKKNHLAWFIVILILNTAGILPIIYLLFFQKKGNKTEASKSVKKKTKR